MSSIPTIAITDTGISIPDATDIFNSVLANMNTAWGGTLNTVDSGTPQRNFSQDIANYINSLNAVIADLMGQFDPSKSRGRIQDSFAKLYFLQRSGATYSTVTALCNGAIGVTITAGSAIARDDNGYTWVNSGDFTFDSSGNASPNFVCQTSGPIQLGIGQLTQISTVISGWDAITNQVTASVGSSQESQAEFEQKRIESVAINASGTNAAIRSAIWALPGVTDVFVDDNQADFSVQKGSTNYTFSPHSIYIAVEGGEDSAIGDAILKNKDSGATTLGNTSVSVADSSGNVAEPYPVNVYNFNRPTHKDLYFIVNVKQNSNLPSTISDDIKAAMLQTFNGNDGVYTKARIGGYVFASNYYYNIASLSKYLALLSIYVGKSASPTETQITMGYDELPVLSISNIIVNLVP